MKEDSMVKMMEAVDVFRELHPPLCDNAHFHSGFVLGLHFQPKIL